METAIKFLKALAEIRNPFLDTLFQLITSLGEEAAVLGVICVLYWCINKDTAYKLGLTFFASGMLVQGLKVSFRVQRPFVIDNTLKPVESAVEGATGYSFPSGHTQSATSLYGFFAFKTKKITFRILLIALFLLVGFSRMYLGVHTYFDVGVSLVITLASVFLIEKLYERLMCGKHDLVLSLVFGILSVVLCIYSYILAKTGYIEFSQINDCFKSGGAGLALAVGFFIERKYIKFDTSAPKTYMQVIKFIMGIAVALALKSGLKLISPGNLLLDFIRYFLAVIWILLVYPIIFSKVLKKEKIKE